MISFGTMPLYDVKLKKGEDFILAKFSRLNPKDEGDRNAIKAMKKDLAAQDDAYGLEVAKKFLDKGQNLPCYAIETIGKEPLKDRITCVMNTNSEDSIKSQRDLEIKNMSTCKKNIQSKGITGSGRAMLYGAVKVAKELGAYIFTLYSSNDDFYEHLGFQKVTYRAHEYDKDFYLTNKDYDKFLEITEGKYRY